MDGAHWGMMSLLLRACIFSWACCWIAGRARCSNSLMEMRNICNHPFIRCEHAFAVVHAGTGGRHCSRATFHPVQYRSALHVSGAEASLPPHPAGLPPEVSLCAKVELLDRCLLRLRAGGHRVLLFSTMTGALDVLQDYLDWRGFSWLRLDGNTGAEERADAIARFNAPGDGEGMKFTSRSTWVLPITTRGAHSCSHHPSRQNQKSSYSC